MQTLAQTKGRGCRGNARPVEELERHQATSSSAHCNTNGQTVHEREAEKEADAIVNEALYAGGASYSEANPGPNGETFSITGLAGGKGVVFADGESRIVQGLSEAHIDPRGAVGLVSRESEKPDAYAGAGRSIPPHSEPAAVGDIIAEEERLIARAKAEGFFWDKEKTSRIIAALGKKGGGSEHDVYFAGTAKNPIVIRSTIQDSYGFRHRSPAQYLKRLQDFNAAFPGIQMRMIGVSQNARGNGVIWTAQPFVEGREFKDEKALQKELEARGWERLGSDTNYRHIETGVVITDAHGSNILKKGRELFPIDVIVSNLGSLEPFSLRKFDFASRAVPADAIVNEALYAGGASYSEANPGPNGETFSVRPANLNEAKEHLRSLAGKEMTTADGLTARVSNNTASKMVSASAVRKSSSPSAHLAAIGSFEELFSRGSIMESRPDRDDNHNIRAIHRVVSSMEFEGRAYDVKFTVKELVQPDQGNRVYSIEAVETSNAAERKRVDADAIAGPTSTPQTAASKHDAATGGQSQETHSLRNSDSTSRAVPADASKQTIMPDGARLVGPTTFSIRAYHGTPHEVNQFSIRSGISASRLARAAATLQKLRQQGKSSDFAKTCKAARGRQQFRGEAAKEARS